MNAIEWLCYGLLWCVGGYGGGLLWGFHWDDMGQVCRKQKFFFLYCSHVESTCALGGCLTKRFLLGYEPVFHPGGQIFLVMY